MNSDCLFCKIAQGEVPSTKVYEDELILAFRDIAPQAPTHILFIPKEHIVSADEITPANSALVAHIFEVIPLVAKAEGLSSYRLVSNIGPDARQSVRHLHVHLLGGREMSDRMA